ncbi:hypothetical protein EXN66_Car016488 [Channa argus]|uniref:Secreted protein n=1 Tax=Channa argus TaxID=215402 RepID=A0A6G1QDQ2_CHAAH|nr:hypothetical protein EXN66_Car016488 [Channa argus]
MNMKTTLFICICSRLSLALSSMGGSNRPKQPMLHCPRQKAFEIFLFIFGFSEKLSSVTNSSLQ